MAIMHLYLLILAQAPALKALQSFEEFRRSQPVMVAEFEVSAGAQTLSSRMIVQDRTRLRYSSKGVGMDFDLTSGPKRILELERTERIYDEGPGSPQLHPMQSRISGAMSGFPYWLLSGSIKSSLPNASFVDAGKETLDGVECQRIRAEAKGEVNGFVQAAIDRTGRVHDMNVDVRSMQGHYAFHWRVHKMDMLPKAPANAFEVSIPDGFVPYAIPTTYGPLEAGNPFPLSGWQDGKGGRLDLKTRLAKKGALVALLGQDSEPSAQARASLGKIRASVPVIVLTDAKKPVAGADGYDRTGKLLAQISAPATPLFVLLDKNGKITHLWMGYDADTAAKFESDVLAAFAGKD